MGISAGKPEQENVSPWSQSPLQVMCSAGDGAASQTLALPVSPLEVNNGSGGRRTRCPAPRNHESRWWEPDLVRGGLWVLLSLDLVALVHARERGRAQRS